MLNTETQQKIFYDITKTIELIARNSSNYSLMYAICGTSPFVEPKNYESLYVNATEDMRTYYQEFGKPKRFLTIGASGEQVLNAINIGAEVIDVYDSNHLTIHGINLRLAAAKALNKEELLFFYSSFDARLFYRVLECLSEEEKLYWRSLYEIVGPFNIINNLFAYKKLEESLVKKINPYLDDENYEQLCAKIDNVQINYLDCDLYSLPSNIEDKKYDAMTFSNIYEYLNFDRARYKKALKYREFVTEQMMPHLENGGVMMVSYLYAFNDEVKKEFEEMYRKHPSKIVHPGAINLEQLPYYTAGFTSQNLSYSMLLDAFCNDPLIKVPTNHVQFGQSNHMDHDMALILRK